LGHVQYKRDRTVAPTAGGRHFRPGAVCLLAWAFVLAGAGTGMNIRAMSTW